MGGEISFKIRMPFETGDNPTVIGDKLRYSTADKPVALNSWQKLIPISFAQTATSSSKVDIDIYSKQPDSQNEDGGVEFNTILYAKPATSQIVFPIETQNLDFFYQPPLNQEMKIGENGIGSCTETDCFDKNGKLTNHRPENIVGSYAVYYKNPPPNYVGGKEYKTGKAFQIFRPKVADANGNSTWGTLLVNTKAKTLTISVDRIWLNMATYPVTIDPNFGYTTAGGSDWGTSNTLMAGSGDSYLGAAGTGVSMSVYGRTPSGSGDFKMALYNNSTPANLITNSTTNAVTINSSSNQWWTATFTSSPTLSAVQYYMQSEASNGNPMIRYDSGATNDVKYSSNSYGTFPSSVTWTIWTGNKFLASIYVTYAPPVLSDLRGGLLGWWKFDGNTKDSSAYGNDGIATGTSSVADRLGQSNKAISFNGTTDIITVPNSASLNPTTAVTIGGWVYDPPLSSGGEKVSRAESRDSLGKQNSEPETNLKSEDLGWDKELSNQITGFFNEVKSFLGFESEYKQIWLTSYETIVFDTPDGDLNTNQYALDGQGTGYYVRTRPKSEYPIEWKDLKYDVSKLKLVKIIDNKKAYYDIFLTAKGATDLYTKGSKYEGYKWDLLPRGDTFRQTTTAEKYKSLALKDAPQPKHIQLIAMLPPNPPPILPPKHHSIGYDNTSNSGAIGAVSSYSFSHTCGAQANLLVFGDGHNASSSRDVTSVTYDGSSLLKIRGDGSVGTGLWTSVWYLLSPTVGSSKTVSVNYNGTISSGAGGVVSYSGAKAYSQPDANNGTWSNSGGNPTINVTTVADNSWVFSVAIGGAFGTMTPADTQRWKFTDSDSYVTGGSDTNGPVTPAGSKTMTWTVSGGGNWWTISSASFAPDGKYTFNPTNTGPTGTIQTYNVPSNGLYKIEAWGAQGGGGISDNVAGGLGAYISGQFTLTSGHVIKVLVGQVGETGSAVNDPNGNENGGGGGTFVVDQTASNTPLVIAGGGGGGYSTLSGSGCTRYSSIGSGNNTTSGNSPYCPTYGTASGGSGGSGGYMVGTYAGGAGGGFSGNGANGGTHCALAYGGLSFLNGGTGGQGNTCYSTNNYGGFGGGGGGQLGGPGGGGGYSGGGAYGYWNAESTYGGGGGSYNGGSNQTNTAGARSGAGKVVITLLASASTITTSAASSVTATTATLNGNITDTGGDNPTVTMYWGDNDGGTTPGNWDYSSAPTSPSQPQGIAAFSKSISSLSPGVKYYFSASATNLAGTVWATTQTFTTTSVTIAGKSTNTYALAIDSGLNVTGYIGGNASSSTQITKAWHHVVMTYDGSNIKIYVDGVLKVTTAQTGAIPTDAFDFKMGASMNGKLDDMRLYGRALSQTEITNWYDEYNSNIQVSDLQKGLVGWWKYDGNTKDSGSYGNPGVATGTTSVADWKGQSNKALSFNGTTDVVTVPSSSSLSPTTAVTVGGWVYDPPSGPLSGFSPPIFDPFSGIKSYLYLGTLKELEGFLYYGTGG